MFFLCLKKSSVPQLRHWILAYPVFKQTQATFKAPELLDAGWSASALTSTLSATRLPRSTENAQSVSTKSMDAGLMASDQQMILELCILDMG